MRTNVPVTTSGGGSLAGKVYVPKTPEVYQYDLDGNLTQDGRWKDTLHEETCVVVLAASGISVQKEDEEERTSHFRQQPPGDGVGHRRCERVINRRAAVDAS